MGKEWDLREGVAKSARAGSKHAFWIQTQPFPGNSSQVGVEGTGRTGP